MKVKLRTLVDSMESINTIARLNWSIKPSFRLSRVKRKMAPLVEDFFEARNKLITSHGEKVTDEKTGEETYRIKDEEVVKKVGKEVDELLDEEVEIDVDPVPISLLENDDVSIAPDHLMMLDWLLTEKEPEES